MSTYKKLNKQDAYITTYTAYKSWAVSGSSFDSYGIQVIPSATGIYSSSLKQLYYPEKVSGSIVSHSFDYYLETTLDNPDTRNIGSAPFVISIPRKLTGVKLKPGVGVSFYINNVQSIRYVTAGYWADTYTNDPVVFNSVDILGLLDDEEGGLYTSGSSPRNYVGDIIYSHGMVIITDSDYATLLRNAWILSDPSNPQENRASGIATQGNLVLKWQSSQPIFTHNYHCKIRESEYNFTYNPSSLSDSTKTLYDNNGDVYNPSGSYLMGYQNDNITGSAFQPYITTVGLYNDANQLIAVGKVGQPIPKSANTEMTIIVKIDI